MPKAEKKDAKKESVPSAYQLFCNDQRAELKKAEPDLKMGEVAKKLGGLWSEASEATKKKYDAKHNEARTKAGLKPKKDANEPKRPLSAYMCFCQAKREDVKSENPEAGAPDILKLLGKAWGDLTDGDKKEYEAAAEKDKARYAKEKAAYDAKK